MISTWARAAAIVLVCAATAARAAAQAAADGAANGEESVAFSSCTFPESNPVSSKCAFAIRGHGDSVSLTLTRAGRTDVSASCDAAKLRLLAHQAPAVLQAMTSATTETRGACRTGHLLLQRVVSGDRSNLIIWFRSYPSLQSRMTEQEWQRDVTRIRLVDGEGEAFVATLKAVLGST